MAVDDTTVTTHPDGRGSIVLKLRGEIDTANVGRLREALSAAIERQPVRIVLDLAQLEFLDSSALGALLGGLKQAQGAGVTLVLASPSPFVFRLLRNVGVQTVFEIVDQPESTGDITAADDRDA